MDFSADGRYLLASCEFSGQLVKVDVARQRVVGTLDASRRRAGMPQDVKLSPDGSIFYVADMHADGVWEIDGGQLPRARLPPHRQRARTASTRAATRRCLYVTNRGDGHDLRDQLPHRQGRRDVADPGGGSPDMGGVSADGKVLWLSGRYNAEVYAISTARRAGCSRGSRSAQGPHGLCVWPQPGRYSLGHTGDPPVEPPCRMERTR